MNIRKILFSIFLSSIITVNVFAKNAEHTVPKSDEEARVLFNMIYIQEPLLESLVLAEDFDYLKLDRSFWKTDVNDNVWYKVKEKYGQQYRIVKVSKENKIYVYTPTNSDGTKNPNLKIKHFDISNDGIIFLDIKDSVTRKRQIISMNSNDPLDINVLIDFHGYIHWGEASMVYSSKSDQLYIETYGESQKINNHDVMYDCGFYLCKRVNGKFSKEGLERSFNIPHWVIADAEKAFLQKDAPGYSGFLDWLYYYCDYGEKVFIYKTKDGKLLTDEEAVKSYIKDDDLLTEDSTVLSKYLKKMKDGVIQETSALSCISNYPKSYPRNTEYQPYNAWLLKTDDGIWLFVECGMQYIDDDGKTAWKCAYMTPYLLEDSNGNYPDLSIKPIGAIHISASVDEKVTTAQNLYGALVYKEKGSGFWNVYKNGKNYNCNDLTEAEQLAKNISEGKFIIKKKTQIPLSFLIVFIIVSLLVMLEAILIFAILSKKYSQHLSKKDKRQIFKIQEAERTKLSHDIHDSVVQNIRAIRLEAEMLEVSEEQQEKKQQVVKDMTDVISLLRNICYNFRPAELTVETDNTELISIIDTLCQQFIARTKIPCQIQIQKDFIPPKMDTEKSTNIVRAIQEALSNIEKHSYATNVQIVIKCESDEAKKSLVIFVIDDGIGYDVNKLGRNKMHFGVRNMRDRIATAGGEIEFFSTPNEGLSVQMRIPYV